MEKNKDLGKDIDLLKITKVDDKAFTDMRKSVISSVQKSLTKIEDIDHRLLKTDNYIARYLPFNNFC